MGALFSGFFLYAFYIHTVALLGMISLDNSFTPNVLNIAYYYVTIDKSEANCCFVLCM